MIQENSVSPCRLRPAVRTPVVPLHASSALILTLRLHFYDTITLLSHAVQLLPHVASATNAIKVLAVRMQGSEEQTFHTGGMRSAMEGKLRLPPAGPRRAD